MSLVRLPSNPREHRQRGRLYRMYGTCKNYPPQHALLNVGFMTILRRTDCFILIWACSAVLTEPYNCHFSNCRSFRTKPEQNKNVVLSCAMLFLETMPVKLYGRSPPDHTAARMPYLTDHGPGGYQCIKIQGSLTRPWFPKVSMSKVLEAQGFLT